MIPSTFRREFLQMQSYRRYFHIIPQRIRVYAVFAGVNQPTAFDADRIISGAIVNVPEQICQTETIENKTDQVTISLCPQNFAKMM